MEDFKRYYIVEDIQNMSISEYAGIRTTLYEQNNIILWGTQSYDYYLSMYVETGDEIYLERMLEKVEIDG